MRALPAKSRVTVLNSHHNLPKANQEEQLGSRSYEGWEAQERALLRCIVSSSDERQILRIHSLSAVGIVGLFGSKISARAFVSYRTYVGVAM